MQPIGMPFFQYFDLDGTPLQNGRLYFGTVNNNPETTPITVYWDAALTQPAAQPISTLNGFIVRDGVMAQLFVASDYSFTVRNNKGTLVTNAMNSAESSFGVMNKAIADATAAVVNIGQSIQNQLWTGFTTTGVSGSYVLTPSPALAAYGTSRWRYNVKFHVSGNGSDVINVSGLGNKSIKQYDSSGAKTSAKIVAGQISDIIYDGVDWVLLNTLSESKPGEFKLAASTIAPAGYLLCPNVITNISRTTYANLFAAIGTTWGVGDGSTTFGMPYFPDKSALLQGNGTLGYGVLTHGALLAHTHTSTYKGAVFQTGYGGGANFASVVSATTITTDSTGGTDNLAAGMGLAIYVKY